MIEPVAVAAVVLLISKAVVPVKVPAIVPVALPVAPMRAPTVAIVRLPASVLLTKRMAPRLPSPSVPPVPEMTKLLA